MSYTAPIADIRNALEGSARLWSLREAFPDFDSDILNAILDGAGQLASEILAPLNARGDREGARLSEAGVVAAPGFKDAYGHFVEGGWQGLSADPQYGGQGLPKAVALAVHEMMHSANMAFGLCPMLTLGAIEALSAHGNERQKQEVLTNLISGRWTGAMNLTEPQAGSDVGALTSRAEPLGEGQFAISGQKIYITWGEHDLTDNTAHLVLARLPDAPAGSRGVSLFLVLRRDAGQSNGVRCIGLERKMGIHASPTCTMAFETAKGTLIGAPNQGLAAMFTMMNSARLNVGLQGVAVAEAAYQKALSYARERRQGRAEGSSETAPSPIIMHADVRRMLLSMKAQVMAGRAICYATAVAADLAHLGDGDMAKTAKAREDLLTPIAKAWCTDMGVEVASTGVQVHGGMGFVEEGGAAQFYRDARIAPIYEGTNGIQAIDLVGRKLTLDGGEAMHLLVADARETAAAARATGAFAPERMGARLEEACLALEEATTYLLSVSRNDRRDALAGATPYLKLAGDVTGGMLLTQGTLAKRATGAADNGQEALLGFYAETVLAQAPTLVASVKLGATALFDEALAEFAD